jgi:hypothetical protein
VASGGAVVPDRIGGVNLDSENLVLFNQSVTKGSRNNIHNFI